MGEGWTVGGGAQGDPVSTERSEVPQMYRVTTEFSGPMVNGGGVSQMYFSEDGGSAANALAAVNTFWTSARDAVHVSTTIRTSGEIEVVNLAGEITGTIAAGDSVSRLGTDDSDPLPPQTQALVRWRTGIFTSGREIRGRTFIPSGGEAFSVAGVPGGGRLTTLATAAGSLVSDTNSGLVVFSRTHAAQAIVSSAQVAPKFAVLRSRRD